MNIADLSALHSTHTAPKAPPTPQQLKLQRAAAEFESQLISSLWKSMKESFASDDDEDNDSLDPSGPSLEDWGMDMMSSAVSKAGGFGIGRMIIKDLGNRLDLSQNGTLPHFPKVPSALADTLLEREPRLVKDF